MAKKKDPLVEVAPPLGSLVSPPAVVDEDAVYAGAEELSAEDERAVIRARRRHAQVHVLPVLEGTKTEWRVKVATYLLDGQWPLKEHALEVARLFVDLVQPAELYEHDGKGGVVDITKVPAASE